MSTDLPAEVRRESRRSISFPVNTMLQSAVQDGDVAELVRLLCHNDEHDAVDVDVNLPNHIGLTPLHHSVLQNNADAVKLLLCNGADVNAQDKNGFTPLHTAAAGGFYLICSMLIAFGADVTLLTNEGDLCLDLAKEEDMRTRTRSTLTAIAAELFLRCDIKEK
ncbi:protein phosphatase 1 regulatory subunit 12A-like [Lingula anatina]|uniref:Protein phosphatase 1 regulatory subunit 12A-like n=1 Tax=Lingula anatina TaxID=7574 RepID=A0A1S3IFP6_LINAN|nr:protein phosphatase 1 regulatory subunit 12A-like [Lingula anatina]|eukprot:XP_013396294.1 protein phosphatase 1 regulatory subunit 12A-like [Lingula anatina]